MSGNLIDKALKHKAKFIPKAGFNLVGLDTFEDPEEALYLIGNYPTRSDAEREQKHRAAQSNPDRTFIYGPGDR